jgi:cytochrome c biogenesis protein CcmG/thiol:disulfide interchange protein DsbE
LANRFEVAAPAADGDAWRVTLRQLGVLLLVGVLIVGAIYLIEGRDGDSAGAGQALALEGGAVGPAPKLGEPAPDFTLANLRGDPVQLAGLRGKPILVNFWATWCPPCRAEMPDLDEVARESSASGLIVLAVNLQEEPLTIAAYLRTLGVGGVSPLTDTTGAIFRQYRVSGLPTTVGIDRDGVVREIHVGPLTKRGIQARVAKIA